MSGEHSRNSEDKHGTGRPLPMSRGCPAVESGCRFLCQGDRVNGQAAYLTGDFGHLGGVARTYFGNVTKDTGAALSWAPTVPGTSTLAFSATAVYLGGAFSTINGTTRQKLAAVSIAGALLSWNPGPMLPFERSFPTVALFTWRDRLPSRRDAPQPSSPTELGQ